MTFETDEIVTGETLVLRKTEHCVQFIANIVINLSPVFQ